MQLSASQDRLRALLASAEHDVLRDYLEERTRLWRRPAVITFEAAPRSDARVWSPRAPVVVISDDVALDGNLVTAGTLIVLGRLRVANLLCAPDTQLYVSGACTVTGLLYAATPDSTCVFAGPLDARVVYSGHGDGWVTALGSTSLGVIDDYVAGADDDAEVTAEHPDARARDLVSPALCAPDGGLDREAALALFHETAALVRDR